VIDLSKNYRPPFLPLGSNAGRFWSTDSDDGDSSAPGQAAYYYERNTSCPVSTDQSNQCYTKAHPESDAEKQNLANWYQYYSLRITAGKSVISRSFRNLPSSVRIVRQSFNDPVEADDYVRPFTDDVGGGRDDFYSWLFGLIPANGTPLRQSVIDAGEFFQREGPNNPYVRNPGGSSTFDKEELSCRRNFNITLTDGIYSTEKISLGNVDGSTIELLPDERSYDPNHTDYTIFSDQVSDTLADIAFNYWALDLRSDLDDNVPPAISEGEGAPSELSEADYWNPQNDPATWQHMVNYFIGFGVTGNYDFTSEVDYNNLIRGEAEWGDPFGTNQEDRENARIDDLWHASINSRGQAFSAADPATLESSLEEIIDALVFTESSVAGVGVSGPSLLGGAEVFQVSFETQFWTGTLEGSRISDGRGSDDDPCNSLDAGTICPVSKVVSLGGLGREDANIVRWADRKVFSFNDGGIDLTGGAARWASLNADQQNALIDNDQEQDGRARLDYVLGDESNEVRSAGGLQSFRNRRFEQKVLGAVVSSAPVYVGNGYTESGAYRRFFPNGVSPTGRSYISFIGRVGDGSVADRPAFVYAASNDGFLHAYDADTLEEQFLYLPSEMFATLGESTEPGFVYRPYVDGDLTEGDVFFNNQWQTLLVGGFRAGGKGLFALDITNPANFDEEDVLWEFSGSTLSDEDEADLGFLFGEISLVKSNLNDSDGDRSIGDWLVAFGNGYNSSNEHAVLYLLDPETGEEVIKLDTGVGPETSLSNPLGANVNPAIPNGLSAPFLVDLNQDFKADVAYAGDLYGNMWRFDLRADSTSGWSVTLVYAAKSSDGVAQPITGQPVVSRHPSGRSGVMVYFGTGQYLEPDDVEPVDERQTFYAVWDRINDRFIDSGTLDPDFDDRHEGNGFDRDHLLQQRITQTAAFPGAPQVIIRTVSDSPIRYFNGDDFPDNSGRGGVAGTNGGHLGWFIDFSEGELVPSNPLLRGGNVIFTTLLPSGDLCSPGGSSFIMELNAQSGGPPLFQSFDNNGDFVVTKEDEFGELVTAGFQVDGTGVYSDPTILFNPATGLDLKVVNTSTGSLVNVVEREPLGGIGRQQWRRLR